jgi:tRNA threonylcarbamoyladenosine biosynthesis protein TsaE
MGKNITTSYKKTQKLGEDFAKNILKLPLQKSAVVLGLSGELGGGKTTFLQGFAKGLGIEEKILSPTFVIQKRFPIPSLRAKRNNLFANFYHIDCYRLKDYKDILELDFKKIISDPKNIVAIEWPEKIEGVLPRVPKGNWGYSTLSGPKNYIEIDFKFINETKREIVIKAYK